MKKRPLGFACLLLALLLYMVIWVRGFPEEELTKLAGKTVTLTGKVSQKQTARQEDQGGILYLSQVSLKGNRFPGKVLCCLSAGQPEPETGTVLKIRGRLQCFDRASNPGQFDAFSYYQILKISCRLNQAEILAKSNSYDKGKEGLYRFRRFLGEKLSRHLTEPAASLMQAMLLGEKSSLDPELKELFTRNGIAHILAISGLHISLLGMGLVKLLRKAGLPTEFSAFSGGLFVFLYGAMTGFSVSTVRAVIMFLLHMLAFFVKRTYDLLTALGVAGGLIVLFQPLYLFHSGFLFSFGCVLGIGLLVPVLTEGEKKEEKKAENRVDRLAKRLLAGAAMLLGSLPVYLKFYYQFPPYCLFLNLLVIPLMSILMIAGLWVILNSILFPPLCAPGVWVVEGILFLYEQLCKFFEKLPFHQLILGEPKGWQLLLYAGILVLIVRKGRKFSLPVRWAAAALGVLILTQPFHRGLTLTFLDVGQGDCIFMKTPAGNCYLVDGGSSSAYRAGERILLPFLKAEGVTALKAVFVTHPDEDHVNGIRFLLESVNRENLSIGCLILPHIPEYCQNDSYQELIKLAQQAQIKVEFIGAGQQIQEEEVKLTCLHPSSDFQTQDANQYSTVLLLEYKAFSALLTGDVEGTGEERLVLTLSEKQTTEGGKSRITVLKAAHHGSGGSTGREFLSLVRPVYTVFSCGRDNAYGHPHREVLERLADYGSKNLITWQEGAVTFWTDGRKVRLKVFDGKSD